MREDNLSKNGNPKTRFTSENQPSGKAKSEGKKKAKVLREVAAMTIKGDFKDEMIKVASIIGIELEEVTIELAMHLKQIQKSLKENDTKAYTAAMDRLKGKPLQEIKQDTNLNGSVNFEKWLKDSK